ncbi:MAG: AAA family ATPase [Smithella sp.]|nr:AAA family ATPase [Smithella sp.]
MKLLRLTLQNFKGIKSLTIEPQGNNVRIWGENGTGKTTIADSINWLLFGKDSGNKKDFDIKTLTPDGQPIHNLEHSVEAEFLHNGKPLLLKKVFKEKWTRKRGTATDEFTGHTTDHFIHGVPVSAREYADKIASICDEETFKLLTSPTYFNTELHWQKRREVLLQVCGDVSDADVIASSKELAELPKILGDHSMDELRKIIKVQKTAINKELEKIPVRIDEAERGLPDVVGLDKKKLDAQLKDLTAKLEAKQAEISRIKNGQELAEKRKALREIEAELLDLRTKHRAKADELAAGKRAEKDKAAESESKIRGEIGTAKRTIANNKEAIDEAEKAAASLRAEWHEVNDKAFEFEQNENCPACKRPLPEEELAQAREEAEADFKLRKAKKLEEITTDGRKRKAYIEMLLDKNKQLSSDVKEFEIMLGIARTDQERLQGEIAQMMVAAGDPNETSEYTALQDKFHQVQSDIDVISLGDREMLTVAMEQEADIKEQLAAVEADLKKFDDRKKGEARIKELAAEEKRLAAEYEQLEKDSHLMEQFERAQAELIESKVNGRFKHATFRLFTQNINGSIEPCCDTLYNGVPYNSGLNKGHQGIVGLDIIATLCEHYGFWPPIIYDNAESVTRLPEMQNQMICLYVSEKDKQLRVKIGDDDEEPGWREEVEKITNTLFGEEA